MVRAVRYTEGKGQGGGHQKMTRLDRRLLETSMVTVADVRGCKVRVDGVRVIHFKADSVRELND